MKLCMGCMNEIQDQLKTCPYCGFNETALRQESYYLDPGTVVGGKYIVGRVLSYGGTTVSYIGMDAEAGRKVIVKEYLPSDYSSRSEGEQGIIIYSGDAQEQFEKGLMAFLNEASKIQQLTAQSPLEGIAAIYDCLAENETGYAICEYVEGQSLQALLDNGQVFKPAEAKVLVQKILGGLRELHRQGVIHGDISPEVILLDDLGGVKLTDFGTMRLSASSHSKSLAFILKQGYAAEEMYRSKGVRGTWTDVYALGAVLYRMITGKVPQESVERALQDELDPPSKLGIRIPDGMETALLNALNVYQDERTPTADVFLQELGSSHVRRIKTKVRRKETGKFPVWAKGLVAGLAVLVVGGSIVLAGLVRRGSEASSIETNAVYLASLEGKTLEEAQAIVDQLNAENEGWDITLEQTEEDVFDLERNDVIASQSVPATTDLSDEEVMQEYEGWTVEDGKVCGTIGYGLYRNDVIRYGELTGFGNYTNAYALAQRLGVDVDDKKAFKPKKDESGKRNYFDIVRFIPVKGKPIRLSEIEAKKNAGKKLKVKGLAIEYYESQFFYWESFEDFVGKNLSELPAYPLYKMENETKRKKTGKNGKLQDNPNLVDRSFYTFSRNYKKGDIFFQSIDEGEKVDTSVPMDEPLLKAVGEVISYEGMTGKELKAYLAQRGIRNVVFDPSGGGVGQPVSSVVSDNECFQKRDGTTITIRTKKPEVPKADTSQGGGGTPAAGTTGSGGGTGGASGGSSGSGTRSRSGGSSGGGTRSRSGGGSTGGTGGSSGGGGSTGGTGGSSGGSGSTGGTGGGQNGGGVDEH